MSQQSKSRLRTLSRRAIASSFVVSLGSLSAMAVAFAPAAHAAEHCTFNWGIKQSYRNYIQGPVAKGGWGADGIGFTGSEPALMGLSYLLQRRRRPTATASPSISTAHSNSMVTATTVKPTSTCWI